MFKTKSFFINIAIVLLFVVIQGNATTTQNQTFDSQQPKEVSDEMWGSLKAAVQEAKLLPTPVGIGGVNSEFGRSVSIDGNRALIGGPNMAGSGAVIVMDFVAGSWVESQILIPNDGELDDQFGYSVSLSGDRALIGAYKGDDNGTVQVLPIYLI